MNKKYYAKDRILGSSSVICEIHSILSLAATVKKKHRVHRKFDTQLFIYFIFLYFIQGSH